MADDSAPVDRQDCPNANLHSLPPSQINQESFQPAQAPMVGDTDMLDLDFWNPNVLSTINWLEGTTDDAFADLSFQNYQMPLDPSGLYSAPQSAPVLPHPVDYGNLTSQQQVRASPMQPRGYAGGPSPLAAQSSGTGTDGALESPITEVGEYYVDGEPARLPRTKRRKLSQKASTPRQVFLNRSFLTLQSPLQSEIELTRWVTIQPSAYEQMLSAYSRVVDEPGTAKTPFEPLVFPPKEHLEHLLAMYAKFYSQSMPFLHLPTFEASNPHWLLLLAMATIAAHYLEAPGSDHFVLAMTELVDRLVVKIDHDPALRMQNSVRAQISLLHVVSLIYSGDYRLIGQGLAMHSELARHYETTKSAARRAHDCTTQTSIDWNDWIVIESSVRASYCLWLLDCMWDFQFGVKPVLNLRDANIPLPCPERLWSAATADEWRSSFANASEQPTLPIAVQQLYIDKKLPKERGEFARILSIHGLFHRQWEVERYLSDPLSQWTPTATKQSSEEVLQEDESVWLPSVPTFTRWQNSACDCLDILHWQANATIGKASGIEHPTVIHLHLARIVLLSPYNHIKQLAKLRTISSRDYWQEKDLRAHEQHVQRWARQCQYKARLAAIHSGVVLWHVRRFSIDAFYEPSAAALAALMLWAFGTYSPNGKRIAQAQRSAAASNNASAAGTRNATASPPTSEAEDECSIILLDRPTDDELVQQFVRVGGTMQARLNGVPDLYAPKGPERVLLEGCKILRMLKCWGSANSWLDMIEPLAKVCQRERKEHEAAARVAQ